VIELIPGTVTDPAAQALLEEYVAYRIRSFPPPGVYRPASPDPQAFAGDGLFLLAHLDGVPRGCGGVRTLTTARFEVKHVFVQPQARGAGVGRGLLDALAQHARERGAAELVLDTHSSLSAAAALYAAIGFEPIAAYNDNPNADRWYRLQLAH
jgi:GNAT superfamily N-acetyltransferase